MRQMSVLLCCVFAASMLMQPQAADASSPPVGHVVYLKGEPSGVRAGRPLWLGIGLGLPVRPFDFFSTGSDELLEIETADAAGVLATIRLQPDSVVYLDLVPGAGERTHEIRLLSGSVSVFMRDADPASQLSVVAPPLRVDAAGAAYDVTLVPSGDVLVTVGSGVVRVRDSELLRPTGGAPGADNGDAGRIQGDAGRIRTLYADPARAVEFARDGTMRTVPMTPGRADRLRSVWRRDVAPRSDAEARRIADDLQTLIAELLPQFETAYRELMSRRDILDRWMETDRQERNPLARPEVTAAEVRQIESEMEAAHQLLRRLETAWYRDNALQSDAATAAVLEEQMHTVRYSVRLYLERMAGLDPEDRRSSVDHTDSAAQ